MGEPQQSEKSGDVEPWLQNKRTDSTQSWTLVSEGKLGSADVYPYWL